MKKLLTLTVITLAAIACRVAAQEADPYSQIAAYDFDKDRAPLVAIQSQAGAATTAVQRAAIENKLLPLLVSNNTTVAGKQFICRMLRLIGSDTCVAPLAGLLTDEKLSHMARYALEGNPSPKVDDALRTALAKTQSTIKIGIINSIGERGDARAVPQLLSAAADKDGGIALASIKALGKIGTADAATALGQITMTDATRSALYDARLTCADRLVARKDALRAAAIYRELYGESCPPLVRIAALRSWAQLDPSVASEVLKLVQSSNVTLQQGATAIIRQTPGKEFTRTLTERLPSLPAPAQTFVIRGLEQRADPAAAPAIAALAVSTNEEVRVAALQALGTLGDGTCVPLLVSQSTAEGDTGKTAWDSLIRVRGETVTSALVQLLKGNDAATRAKVLDALSARHVTGQTVVILQMLNDSNTTVHTAALKALRTLAGANEVPSLVTALVASKTESDSLQLEQIISAAINRATDPKATVSPVLAAMNAPDATKVHLINILGRAGGTPALEAIRPQLKSSNAAVKSAAIRVLSDWTEPAPLDDLLSIATGDPDETTRILALRGYITLTRLAKEKLPLYKNALKVATRPDEIQMVLGGLSQLKNADSLTLAATCLNKPAVTEAAVAAMLQIADTLKPIKAGDPIGQLLLKGKEATKDAGQKHAIDKLLGVTSLPSTGQK